MAKTSLELYQESEAIDAGDRDPVISQTLMKNLALSMANFASAMESVSQFHGAPADDTAPEALLPASDLYAEADAINANDRGDYTMNQLLRISSLTMAKIAIETEAFAAALRPQAIVRQLGANLSLSSSRETMEIFGVAEVTVTQTPNIVKTAVKDSGVSVTPTSSNTILKVYNRVINPSMTVAPTVSKFFTRLHAAGASIAASLTKVPKKDSSVSTTLTSGQVIGPMVYYREFGAGVSCSGEISFSI